MYHLFVKKREVFVVIAGTMPRLLTRLLLLYAAACALPQAAAIVDLNPLTPFGFEWQAPVTDWLLSSDPRVIPVDQRLAWRKIGVGQGPS
jgi:hypothetical protein